MKKLIIARNSKGEGNPFGSPSSSKSGVVFELSEQKISATVVFGCCPTESEFFDMSTIFIAVAMNEIAQYKRKNPFRITSRAGYSGCLDWLIETAENHEFPRLRKILHVSMCNKINENMKNVFVWDLVELMATRGWISREEENIDSCVEIDTSNYKMIEPRDISTEDGWIYPK